jgi:hypothetical protein
LGSVCQLGKTPQLFHLEPESNQLVRLHNDRNAPKYLVISSSYIYAMQMGLLCQKYESWPVSGCQGAKSKS